MNPVAFLGVLVGADEGSLGVAHFPASLHRVVDASIGSLR